MDEIDVVTKHEMCVETCYASVFVIFPFQDKSRFSVCAQQYRAIFVWKENQIAHGITQVLR
jgi:hypothetical protein